MRQNWTLRCGQASGVDGLLSGIIIVTAAENAEAYLLDEGTNDICSQDFFGISPQTEYVVCTKAFCNISQSLRLVKLARSGGPRKVLTLRQAKKRGREEMIQVRRECRFDSVDTLGNI